MGIPKGRGKMGGSRKGKVNNIGMVTDRKVILVVPIKLSGPDHILFQLSKYFGVKISFSSLTP